MAGTIKEVVSTGLLIFRRLHGDIEYLLLHASYERGNWSPPKGHVDPGENEMDTAYREVEEESGFLRHHLKFLDGFQKTLRYQAHSKPKRVEYWVAELIDPSTPVQLSDEHIEYKWLNLNDSKQYIKYPDLLQAYEEAQQFIKNTD